MIIKYLDDYYRRKLTVRDICRLEGISHPLFYAKLREVGEKPFREHYKDIDVGAAEVNEKLKVIYNGIIQRCNGKEDTPAGYHGLDYMDIKTWVKFCNDNKHTIVSLWARYVKSGKKYKYTISIDREDESKGYVLGNVSFAPLGFNAWKRNIRPIEVQKDGTVDYFMSCEEGSRKLGVSHSYVGAFLLGVYSKETFIVKEVSTEKVLSQKSVNDVSEYYQRFIA